MPDFWKRCGYCDVEKLLSDFFRIEGFAGTSRYCKQCHAAAKIKHGYGCYGDRYTAPETANGCEGVTK